ncbi:hypothetical protein [Spiroplasma endosymbiont of Diplazon laetatorius]|uniref:hypothetical protein n=1 Tax=Spiroplasma endosymbiont of Diplazon laetatorius TaxID=3066322 RepID=UPI0030CAD98A
MAEKEYLDPEAVDDFGQEVINYIKAWNIVRDMVLKIKEFEKKFSRRVDVLLLDEFVALYKLIDPEAKYVEMFKGYSENSREFLTKLERIISKLTIVETFDSLIEYLLAAAYDLTAHDYLGDMTFKYLFWLVETAMISRGHGIVVFEDRLELEAVIELHQKVIVYAKTNNSKNFALCKEFRQLVSMFKDKIEQFSHYDKERYSV